ASRVALVVAVLHEAPTIRLAACGATAGACRAIQPRRLTLGGAHVEPRSPDDPLRPLVDDDALEITEAGPDDIARIWGPLRAPVAAPTRAYGWALAGR